MFKNANYVSGNNRLKSLFLLTSFACASLLFNNSLFAEEKVAIVDMQNIEMSSLAVNSLIEKLQEEQTNIQKEISSRSQDLQKRAKDLEGKRGVLSAAAIDDQRKSIESDLINLQTEAQAKNESMQRAKMEGLGEIDQAVRDIISVIAKKSKYDIVIAKQVALYIDESKFSDITKDVVSSLNLKLKTVDVDKYLKPGEAKKSTSSGKSKPKK